MMTDGDVQAWLAEFKAAWEAQDATRFIALFAPGCEYRDTPFSEPIRYVDFGQFWTALATEQSDNDMQFERVEVMGDRAIVFWRAFTTRRASGQRMEGDGVMALCFDAAGKCSDLREWQHARVAGTGLVQRVFGNG